LIRRTGRRSICAIFRSENFRVRRTVQIVRCVICCASPTRAAALGAVFAVAASAAAETRQTIEIPLNGGTMSAVMFVPAKMPAPAVIVLHTAAGRVETADESFAAALAKEGFVAIAPNYTANDRGRPWSPAITGALLQALQSIRQRPEVAAKPIGAVGFSLGAHAVMLSARTPALRAIVVYYGAYDVRKAKGLALPPAVKLPIDVAAEVKAPMLMLHGAADDEIPLAVARDMAAALKAAGKRMELVVYPGAYHRFDRGPVRAGREVARTGYIYRYDAAATRDAWQRTLAWLKQNLGS
jgi:carboxymethylenebutenolidase